LEIVVMNMEGIGGEWFEELPHTGWIYQQIERTGIQERKETRIRSLTMLGESGDPRAVSPLIKCSTDDSPDIRRHATKALMKLQSARGVEALSNRLKDAGEEWATRKLAADALGEIRSHGAIESLIACLEDPSEDPAIRIHVASVLAKTGTEIAWCALQQCHEDASPAVRKATEEALRTFDISAHTSSQKSWSSLPAGQEQAGGGAGYRR
jgi:HEAT repeat protein